MLGLADECFSSVILETRSSQSVDAVLKDFVAGGFESCGAKISISPSGVNAVNGSHTFTVTLTKNVGGIETGVSGAKPTVTLTASDGATLTNVNKTDCETTGTDANGQCDVTFSSSSAGIVTGHAAATVTIGTTSFSVQTDGLAGNSGDASSGLWMRMCRFAEWCECGRLDAHVHDHDERDSVRHDGGEPVDHAEPDGTAGFVLNTDYTTTNTCSALTGTGNTRSCTLTITAARPARSRRTRRELDVHREHGRQSADRDRDPLHLGQ